MKITKKVIVALKKMLSIQCGTVETNAGKLFWDGSDEDLKEGMEVFVEDENGELVPAPDNTYTTEDGKIIKVVDGKVENIDDPEAEVASEAESEGEQVESNITAEVDEPADDSIDTPETEEVSDEDKVERLAARVEEIIAGLNEIINAMADFDVRLTEVEGKLANVEAPAADPIDEKPQEVEQTKKSRLSYLRKN